MAKAPYFDAVGKRTEIELTPELFDVEVNEGVLHEVVQAQIAGKRGGNHKTKTRSEVSGGGAKPWRQKGLGRARHGSIREPQWRGGGVAHGPVPRSYDKRINKKERALAFRSALTDRAREGNLRVVEMPAFEEPSTRSAVGLLKDWGAEGRVLLVVGRADVPGPEQNAMLSFRNLPYVEAVTYSTAYSLLDADVVVFTKAAFEELTGDKKAKDSEEASA